MEVGSQRHAPACSTPTKETWYALYRKLGGPPGPVWTDAENLAATGNYKRNTLSNIVT